MLGKCEVALYGEKQQFLYCNFVLDSIDKDLPPYLEEETQDTPDKDDHTVARADSSFTSMAGSWFGSVLSAVNKNLYW